jgi:hypothetical protein
MENYHGNYAEGMTTRGTTDSYLPDHDMERDGLNRRSYRSDASTPWEMFAEFSGTINSRHPEHGVDHSFYRGQPRTSTGRFRRSMMRRSHEFESEKKRIAGMLAEQCDPEILLDKAIKEAGEFVTYAASGKPFEAMKEFAELAILVCAISEHLPEELTEAAEMEALDYYSNKVEHHRYSHKDNPLYDYDGHMRHR